jgi:hypothetical protein
MRLEEKGEYETIWGNKVRIQWSFDLEEMLMYYESELSEILNISHKSEDAWYYTTLAFSNLQYGGYSIPNTNIYVKTSWSVTTLWWTTNPRVTTAIWTTYVAGSSPLTFIQRTAWANSSVTGTYWVQTILRVDIPALQTPGTYTGTIIYTLY